MSNKHIIAAAFAILVTSGIWMADKDYYATNSVALDTCGDGNIKAVVNEGPFDTGATCFKDK